MRRVCCFASFALASNIALASPELDVMKSLPPAGTQDESELIVKYRPECSGAYRIVEGEKANQKPRHVTTFNRLSEVVAREYESNHLGSSRISVDVSISEADYKFYNRRTATFGAQAVESLAIMPQAMGLPEMQDGVRETQQERDSLTVTCEFQSFINLDICKFSNYEGKLQTRRIEQYLSRDDCVEFAEFSVQLKAPMGDESEKIIENFEHKHIEDTLHRDPVDQYFKRYQWFLLDEHNYSINAQSAWSVFKDNSKGDYSRGVVGVVDTGVWMNYPGTIHQDLKDKMWRNEADCDFDGLDSDSNGYIDDCNGWNFGGDNNDLSDYHGHGTSVSGTVGAATNNTAGVASIGWPVRIMTLKTYFRSSEFAKIVNYMAGFGVKIMNGSFAYGTPSKALEELTTVGKANGILMVFAASNENCDNDAIVRSPTRQKQGCDLYPASLPTDNILSVCSSNERGGKSYFSSFGKTTVDVCAPGSGIFTTHFSSSCALSTYTHIYVGN